MTQFIGTLTRIGVATAILGGTLAVMRAPMGNAYADSGSSAIAAKYTQARWLGTPTSDEHSTPHGGGRYRHFQYGSIYWTPATGAHEVHGDIYRKWASLGWERSALGFPTTDELATPDGVGRFSHFQHGSIYWTPATGAHEVHGDIRGKWASLGWERSALGYPTTDEMTTPDGRGRYNEFEHGSIYWTPATGAHEIGGAILNEWLYHQAGPLEPLSRWDLGYPTTDELATADGKGRYNGFQNGEIYWSPATGAHALWGHIDSYWHELQAQGYDLGYPIDDQSDYYTLGIAISWHQEFEHGRIDQDLLGFDQCTGHNCPPLLNWGIGPTPMPHAPTGYSQVQYYNCNVFHREVHVWVNDVTAGGGPVDQGTLSTQYDDYGACPGGGADPITVSLAPRHVYEIIVVDVDGDLCPSNDPSMLSCRAETDYVTGLAGAGTLTQVIST